MTSRELVFRADVSGAVPVAQPEGVSFRLLSGPVGATRVLRALLTRYGWRGTAKAVAKVATPTRVLYCVRADDGEILHEGWLLIGRWPGHDIGPRDVVIGPIRTRSHARGRGLAAYGICSAMDAMGRRGYTTFLIGTRESNTAARRVIEKSGFVAQAAPKSASTV